MITIVNDGSYEKQIFQYAFGRVLARRFGYRLNTIPLPWFRRTREKVSGEEMFGPCRAWFGQWPIDNTMRNVTREELYTTPGVHLSLTGSFQRFELFCEERDLIRDDWFKIDGIRLRAASDFAISVIGTRDDSMGAQFPTRGLRQPNAAALAADSALTEYEIRRLASSVSYDRLFIVTKNDPDKQQWRRRLWDLTPTVKSGNEHQRFRFLMTFQKIAISQNGLDWWAAFLGRAREIFFPACDRGYWGHSTPARIADEPGHYGVDLRVDEERYIYDWSQ